LVVKAGLQEILTKPVCVMGQTTARELFGNEHVVTNEDPSMGAEDFAFYAQRVPAAMFRLGIRPEEMDVYPGLHHPKFNFNDAALPTGSKMFCETARRFLNNSK
jgi:metal-dependent amidase/aminoacylase/carboxypeptidase family protein